VTGGAVSLQGLVKNYDDVRAVDRLDLEIEAGEFFSLLGESGCGKTTTLRMIAGFEDPDEGRVVVDGEDLTGVSAHKRPVNTVFQSYALFPFLSVWENVGFGLRYAAADKAETNRRIGEALELVELGALAKRKPHQLSGGQQQRVALARALVLRPRVLLLDEPLGALDARLRKQLQRDLRALHQRVRTTFVYVTHDQEEALTMSDRLAVIVQGKVEQLGTPSEVYAAPATAYVASFLGNANLYQADILTATSQEITFRIGETDLVAAPAPVTVGQTVTVMVRPERIEVSPAESANGPVDAASGPTGTGNVLAATVRSLTFQGAHTVVAASADGLALEAQVANIHGESPAWLVEGGRVCLRISASAVRVLGD
jgi:spermidine/putrescine transport system ATP-binding protein